MTAGADTEAPEKTVEDVTQTGELLNRLTGALSVRDPGPPLSSRLCDAYREVTGADGAALTVHYESADRVTLCATSEVANRLEDLQDVVGEGPGHAASASGQIESCTIPTQGSPRWSIFVDAAQDLVQSAQIHAVPLRPSGNPFGVITLYQSPWSESPRALERAELQFLADVAAPPPSPTRTPPTRRRWARGPPAPGSIQATGMVVSWRVRGRTEEGGQEGGDQLHGYPMDLLAGEGHGGRLDSARMPW